MKKGMIVSGSLFIISLVLIALAFTGCAAFNKLVTNNELTMQLATEAATARIIHEHPFWKNQVVTITADAMAFIGTSTEIQLGDVEEYVKGKIAWGRMLPEEQAVVSVLITQVRKNLEDNFRAQSIENPLAQMIEVRKVLGWINAAAKRQ